MVRPSAKTWLIAIVFTTSVQQYEMTDSCSSWRLKIHNGIEQSGQALGLDSFMRNIAAGVSAEKINYTNLQLRLESIAESYNLYEGSDDETNRTLQNLQSDAEVQEIVRECEKSHVVPTCSSRTQYRRADGICNNLKHPMWGSGDYSNERMMPPAYNGISGIRRSVSGEDLPLYRSISLKLKNTSNPSQLVSAFFTYYGQSIVHDITLIPRISANSSTISDCCTPNENPSVCAPLFYGENDPLYGRFNKTCVPVIRTAPYPTCGFNKRIQMNKITSFLDLSIMYGSTKETEKAVRGKNNLGRLKTQDSKYGKILPKSEIEDALFCQINGSKWCFLSGDERVNQHVELMSLQTMYVRWHNKMHDILHSINPHWNGEKLYLETRRLVTALQQNMVYNEYLPLLVGRQNMRKHKLYVDSESLYDDEVSPNMLIEFNTASFRLHSMVPRETSKFHPKISFDLTYSFFCPLHNGQIDSYVGGACEVPSEKNDHFVKDDVKGFLHRPPGGTYGDDLPSINIARGRDHGLPVYIDMVKTCSNGKITINNFSDLSKLMNSENIRLLESIYRDVRDIDLWVGLILERELRDAVTGPTAACISSTYFHRMKYGDSFFFTHKNGRYPFTKAQLKTIRKYSLSRFICDTTDLTQIRKQPLSLPGNRNPLIYCGNWRFDLSAWKEKK